VLYGQAKNDIGVYDHTVKAGRCSCRSSPLLQPDYAYCVAQQTSRGVAKKIAESLASPKNRLMGAYLLKRSADMAVHLR
jgi:hypothetical protein